MTQDPLAVLKGEFVVRARADRIALIAAMSSGDLGRVERLAHGLAGSAGMFGYAEISSAAMAVDDGFASGRGLDIAAVDRLGLALNALG